MCGARCLHKQQNRAAWLLFFFFLLLLAMSRGFSGGDQELVIGKEDSYSPPMSGGGEEEEEEQLSRMGSAPPRCERRCGGCAPCAAVQVRAAGARLAPQCSNYEPVRWKCKCGDAVFDP